MVVIKVFLMLEVVMWTIMIPTVLEVVIVISRWVS